MTGVAGPMLRQQRSEAYRFLLGLGVGGLLASLALALVAWAVGSSLAILAPTHVRVFLLAGICALFGVVDLFDRTPHLWRQVPQSLVRALPPGQVALAWGFDMGLLFTTQKVVSLLWAAFAAVVLVAPAAGPTVLGGAAFVSSLTIAAWTLGGGSGAITNNVEAVRNRVWTRRVRALSGLLLIATATATALRVFPA
jgi:hypothetical protein